VLLLPLSRARGGIAVIDLHGMIGPQIRPLEYTRLFAKLRVDRSVRAVVLNIDSQGGSASGSELMALSLKRLAGEKPLAAFIGGLGASGGYMLASSAHRVIALPSAIVGAIGVISYRPIVHEALDRLGVRVHVAKSGRLKDMLSPFREMTEEEREKEQSLIDSMHDLFVASVAEGRGMPPERVRELATGEVFVAGEAVKRGLVDGTGDLEDAIDWAVEESGAPRKIRIVRPRRTLRDVLIGRTTATLTGLLLGAFEPPPGPYFLYGGPGDRR
jgi:protease-4